MNTTETAAMNFKDTTSTKPQGSTTMKKAFWTIAAAFTVIVCLTVARFVKPTFDTRENILPMKKQSEPNKPLAQRLYPQNAPLCQNPLRTVGTIPDRR